jgi:hypothetical protein
MKHIVLISCVSEKIETKPGEKVPAEKLYVSDLFNKNLAYAKKLNPDKMYILSAKHHLTPMDKEIETYNETLKEKSSKEKERWAKEVVKQLKEEGYDLNVDKFTILAGKAYYGDLLPYLRNVELPMEGLRIGQMKQWLKEHI